MVYKGVMEYWKDLECTVPARVGDRVAVVVVKDHTFIQPNLVDRPTLEEGDVLLFENFY